MSTESIGNPFNELVTNMINMQLTSISTQETVSTCNTVLTNANQELSQKWVSCSESSPNDPGYGAYQALMAVGTNNPTGMQNWVNTYLGAKNADLNQFSSAFMTEVYNVYEQNAPSSTSNQTALGLISNVSNLLQAAAQADEQTGQNGISLINNLQQHFESDQGPLSSATTTIIDGLNNYSSAMQSISA